MVSRNCRGPRRAYSVVSLAFCVGILLGFPVWAVNLDEKVDFSIPPQRLSTALLEFSHQAKVQVIIGPEVENLETPGISGTHSIGEALSLLLKPVALSYRVINDTSITIGSPSATLRAGPGAVTLSNAKSERAEAPAGANTPASTQSPSDQPTQSQSSHAAQPASLEDIVVTAQKRNERLQDVPVSLTVVNTQTLIDNNLVQIQDYYSNIPGLSVTSQGFRDAPILAIRGIVTGTASNPTVGIIVDDVPYGASTNLGGGTLAPDFDPGDLNRIEVLRGPQGTLYGAASMGGLIKYVTVDPSTEALSGRVEAGTSDVHNGAEPGYAIRGSANVPVSDTLALRVSGFSRQDPGYIDDPGLDLKGVNEEWDYGGRVSALWKPAEFFSAKLSALIQDDKTNGSPLIFPALGDLQQTDARGTGQSDKRLQAYTATLSAQAGRASLTSISGYNVNTFSDVIDFSQLLGPYLVYTPFAGVSGWAIPERNKTSKFTQEVRLSMPIGSNVDWLLGLFYDHESNAYEQTNLATNSDTGALAGELGTNSFPSTYQEYAAFTDVTIHFSDPFDVQIGGRESEIRQTYSQTIAGSAYTELFYALPSPIVQPQETADANAFTYLVTPRYKLSPDLMIYARAASGYRPGAINLSNTIFKLPLISEPDKTQSYEVGLKGDALNKSVTFDASVYRIEWKDIQLTVIDPRTGNSIYVNGSRARSQGVEVSSEAKPLAGLTVAAWVAFNDAQLTEPIPMGGAGSVVGTTGDRLPYSSRFSGNLSLSEDFPLWNAATGFVGATLAYVGERTGEFTSTEQRQELPAYATTNARAGVKYESWTYNLYVDNAFDRRGVLSGGLGTYVPDAFTYIRPRTVGLMVSKKF